MTEPLSHGGYGPLIRVAGVRSQVIFGLLAQVTQGAGAAGIILVVRQHTGSLALAGGVVGGLSVAAGIARPIQGRLIDRRGARRVIALSGALHGLALAAIVGVSNLRSAGVLLIALGCLAGFALPPISASMRVEIGAVAGAGDRTSAYSLVYLTQELALLTGPLLLAAFTAAASASVALLAVASVAGLGAIGFAASARSEPPAGLPDARPRAAVLRVRAMRIVLLIATLIGAMIGGLEVAAPTLAIGHRAPAATGLLVAALSVGGILGAAGYGSHPWRYEPTSRLIVLLVLLTVAVALMIASSGLVLVGGLLLLAGIALNPALTTLSLLVDRQLATEAAGEAFGWLSSALAGGTGAASALAAGLVGRAAGPAFAVAAVAGAAAATATVLFRSVLAARR